MRETPSSDFRPVVVDGDHHAPPRTDLCLAQRWLKSQNTEDAPVSTNQPALELPFQRWFKFKEAFSPQFILDCIACLNRRPRACIDPFGGSGTTALTAQFLGIRPTTIEVNPFLADLIEAKLSQYDTRQLLTDYFAVLRQSEQLRPSYAKFLEDGPQTLVQPGEGGRWVYPKEVAKRIFALRDSIAAIKSRQNRLMLTVILGSTLIPLSNVIVNGKGRKYRCGWKVRQKIAPDVELAFRSSFFDAFSDICHFAGRPSQEFSLIRGDSRKSIELAGEVDFAVLSPPYPNSFDYTDIYNIELWMLGYLASREDNVALRQDTLRSHVQIHRPYSTDMLGSKSLARAYGSLCHARKALWNRHIPEMICAYFSDMQTVLTQLKRKLVKDGKVFLAIGNSKYAGVIVDAEKILMEVALAHGYRRASSHPIRSMRASAQQGGRRELTESLLILN